MWQTQQEKMGVTWDDYGCFFPPQICRKIGDGTLFPLQFTV